MISICVPCYEMHGKGSEYLNILLSTLLEQTFKKFEVVISDQSLDNSVFDTCENFRNKLDIKYIKCEQRGKSSFNLNNAIHNAKYDIIKPIFQDDFLIDINCLYYISQIPETDKWGGIGFTHFNEVGKHVGNTLLPLYNFNIKNGVNTFGSPSVCFFRKEENYFNNELVWLMDCEFYEKMYRKYGPPRLINTIGVGVRLWGDSYSYHISDEIKNKENQIVRGLYA
jgi:hypothetical protein